MRLIKSDYMLLPHLCYASMLDVVTRACSTCYRSKMPIDRNEQEVLVKARIKAGHESIIEHVGFSVEFVVDRGITHELVRHRLASYTQESTRFCSYANERFDSEVTFIMPAEISVVIPEGSYDTISFVEGDRPLLCSSWRRDAGVRLDPAVCAWAQGLLAAEQAYLKAVGQGMPPEIARGTLPNATAARIVVTANVREWRHIFRLRALGTTGRPHPQMKEVMEPLLMGVCGEFPAFFLDLLESQSK